MGLIRDWNAMSSQQQRLIAGSALLIVVLATLFFTRLFMISYVPMYRALTPNQMVSVMEQLNQDEVDYRIRDTNVIFVPETYLVQERDRMISLDIPGDKIPDQSSTVSPITVSLSWINPLLYMLLIGIGLYFLLSVWQRFRYTTRHLKELKTDVDARKRHEELSVPVVNENELTVPAFSGHESLAMHLEKRIELHEEDVAVLIEALLSEGFEGSVMKEHALESHLQTQYLRLSRLEKTAFVLGQLKAEVTAALFVLLRPKRMREISQVLSSGIVVDRKIARVLLEEFIFLMQSNPYVKSGSRAYVKEVLYHAIGHDEAEQMISALKDTVHHQELSSLLSTIRPEALADVIRGEHPQTLALLLAHLDAKGTAKVLACFSVSLAEEILRRIAMINFVAPDVIEQLIDVMESKLHRDDIQYGVGGRTYVQQVHNLMDHDEGSADLGEEENQPALDAILSLENGTVRSLLRVTGKKELIYALKGASEELQEKFFANMSPSVAKRLRNTMGHLQKITAKEINDAQEKLLQRVRSLDEE